MRSTIVVLVLSLSAAGAAVGAPPPIAAFSFETAFGRLPKNVVPLDYSISITPDAQARTLTGTEKVLLQVRSSTDTIVFNSLNETLHDVRLDGKPVKTIDSNDDKQLTTLTLNSPAASGRHTLTFSYDGKMEAGPRGMFAQPYIKPDGGRGLRVSTKFESTDARSCTPLPRQRPARRSSDATIRR